MDIRNKVALVSGGAHRLGKSIALALAGHGAHVVFTYLRAAAEAAQTQADIEALGVQAMAARLDQGDPAQIDEVLAAVRRRFGRLDVLVNSAAIMERRPLFDITPADWDRTLGINLRGPFFVAQGAARLMLESSPERSAAESKGERSAATGNPQGSPGCIVNIADLAALHPWPSYIAHTVSKAGLVALTRALALALAPSIRVNAVAPGAVLRPDDWSEERWDRVARGIPLGRAGTPEDVARAVLYLAGSDFITGQVLVLDGGRELR